MRLAVFSDVHANLPALNAVLHSLGKQRVKQVFCLGDLVGRGPFPAETIEALRAANVVCLSGGADARVLAAVGKARKNRLESWTLQHLADQDVAFLKSLPTQYELLVGGRKVLMVHRTSTRNGADIYSAGRKSELRKMLADSGCHVLIAGGGPEPFARQLKGGWVINCGCLGKRKNGTGVAQYALVSIAGADVRVSVQEARYSREALLRAAVKRDFPLELPGIVGPAEQESQVFENGINAALRSLERSFSKALNAALKQQSPENVRDLRIEAGRLQQALGMFSTPRKLHNFVKALKRLRKTAGDLRELDILLKHIVSADKELPAAHANGVAGFVDELASQRETAKGALAAELKHRRTARLAQGLKKQLRAGLLHADNDTVASPGIRSKFFRTIRKVALRAAGDLELTHNVLQRAEFHDLRITSKRLRYSLEILQQVSGSDYGAEVDSLRDFQKLMGGIHDFDTSTELIARLQHSLRRKLAPEDLRAADFLAFIFQKERVELFGRFLEVSHDFAASRFFNSLVPDRPNL